MISPIPQLFLYDFPLEIVQKCQESIINHYAHLVKESQRKLSALGTVPLTNPDKSSANFK